MGEISGNSRLSGDNVYEITELQFEDLVKYPQGLQDMHTRKADGFLVRNLLNEEEVSSLLVNLRKQEHFIREAPAYGILNYPRSFSQILSVHHDSAAQKSYFKACEEFRESFSSTFSLDFQEKIKHVFQHLCPEYTFVPTPGFDNDGLCAPFTFRLIHDGGWIYPHCGNFFHSYFPEFFAHLFSLGCAQDHLAYFVMLQLPEEGGELLFYDFEWAHADQREAGDTAILIDKQGGRHDLLKEGEVKRLVVSPQPGDLITFPESQIWHCVDYVRGNRKRITLGGFLSLAHDQKRIYQWA